MKVFSPMRRYFLGSSRSECVQKSAKILEMVLQRGLIFLAGPRKNLPNRDIL